ncbi:hypothetical protein A5881_003895 [Enterococcus termitis]
MTKENRFSKLQYNPNSEETNNAPVDQKVETVTTSTNSDKNSRVSLNINKNENVEIKVPTNFTLYPSQKNKLKELGKYFGKSGSTLIGEVIDQLHDAYINK